MIINFLKKKTRTIEGEIKGPRWAQVEDLLKQVANHCHVYLDIKRVEKGIISQTIVFEITGIEDDVDYFELTLRRTLAKHKK